jgi:hypothetical protein
MACLEATCCSHILDIPDASFGSHGKGWLGGTRNTVAVHIVVVIVCITTSLTKVSMTRLYSSNCQLVYGDTHVVFQ